MKYLRKRDSKETKVRILTALYERLKGLSIEKGMSLNVLFNKALEGFLREQEKEDATEAIEKQNLFYDDGQIKLLLNDFLKVDLEELRGRVNLIVTSPPYNVGMEYGTIDDSIGYEEYLRFTERYLKRFYELLADDGRVCLNIPLDKNKGGIQSVYADVVCLAKKVGLKYQSTIVWNEQNISRRTAWGSWLSASAPYIIAPVEMVVLLYKEDWKRRDRGKTTISREEFIEWTNGMWTFPGENRKALGHPAPFPLELPLRCIKLFSYEGDLVLDPFVGSGTTMVACRKLNRRGVGIDINKNYLKLAVKRIKEVSPAMFSW